MMMMMMELMCRAMRPNRVRGNRHVSWHKLANPMLSTSFCIALCPANDIIISIIFVITCIIVTVEKIVPYLNMDRSDKQGDEECPSLKPSVPNSTRNNIEAGADSLRNHVSLRISFSSNSPNLTDNRSSCLSDLEYTLSALFQANQSRLFRRALRFSMQEFHAITGLKYKDDEPDLDIDNWRGDKGFWSKLLRRKGKISLQQIRKVHLKSCNTWSHVDRLRMVYLCVIAGLVMAKDEKVSIPHKYIKLVMDFDKMRKFMWVLHSFDATSITETRDKVKTRNSYVIDGFSYALQIWLMEAIPDIGSLLGEKLREGVTSMRCRNWKGSAKVSYEDIISIETDFASTGFVFPYISSTGNGNIIVDAGFERDDEMNNERVDLINDMNRKKYDWSKHVWGYQETVQPYAYSSEEDGSKEEEAGETSDCGMEEEIETAHVSPSKKRKN
ncbi:hypothetical protein F2Q69_00049813 [Brassica cretica]|uniref:DUF1985 domain-containing protein n=1 Tax=Brassica cretica TaxID=69181 RepID=A0A8S9PLD2_BRACR|nr:hypothetical protein F2Q69_00049813 [Brassica cretica]